MITETQRELEVVRRRSVARVARRVLGCLSTGVTTIEDDILERHPLAALVHRVALREGPAGRSVIQAVNDTLSARAARDAERIRTRRLVGLQCPFVLPARETRDAALAPAAVGEAELEAVLDRHADAVASVMPDWWFPYVGIATSYTAVTINGCPASSRFSGTFSDAFGAVHAVIPETTETYVEVLTHEAGHLWLNLLEDRDPTFVRNPYTERRFVSPWRQDARPIHGILHGAYVFSVAVPALLAVRTEAARARAVQLAVRVRDAVRQVLTYGSLSAEATAVAVAAGARVEALATELGAEAVATADELYRRDKEQKVRRLMDSHPDLQVV